MKRFVLNKGLLIGALLFSGVTAQGVVTVEPPSPYRRIEDSIFYPKTGHAGTLDSDISTFDVTDTVSSDALILIHVSSDKDISTPSGETLYLWVFMEETGGTWIPVPIQAVAYTQTTSPTLCASTTVCDGVTPYIQYPSQQTITLGIHPETLCAFLDSEGDEGDGCSADTLINRLDSTANDSIHIRIGMDTTSTPDTPADVSAMDDTSEELSLYFVGEAPTDITCPASVTDFYFPGDSEIIFERTSYGATTKSAGIWTDQVYLLASTGVLDTTEWHSNELAAEVERGAGSIRITGFTNDVDYNVAVLLRNSALIGSVTPDACSYVVRTTEILGLLAKGNCFFATGVFNNPDHPFLSPLRQFRNRFLNHFSLGRWFVHQYGLYGPQAGAWVMAHPKSRWFLRTPISVLSLWVFVMLHPIFWMLSLFLGIGFLVRVRVRHIIPLLVFFAWSASALGVTETPYLDAVKESLKDEGEGTSFIEGVQKDLETGPQTSSENYTEALYERLKQKDSDEEQVSDSESYTESIRSSLKSEGKDDVEATSYSEQLKKGEIKLKPRIDEKVRFFFGMNFSAYGSRSVSGGTYLQDSYENVYGNGYVPELDLLFEWQPLHSEWVGSLGLVFNSGISFVDAPGKFKTPVSGFSSLSRTWFNFLTVPALVGVSLRWNTLRFIRPYGIVAGGPLAILETRGDSQKNKRAVLLQWMVTAGLNLRLDDFSKSLRWSMYDSTGIKHTYLAVEYRYTQTLQSALDLRSSGVYVGFGFEL